MAERRKAGLAPADRAARPRVATNPDGTMSFKDAAERVLRKARRPLHYKMIVANAIRDRLIPLDGKTPEATMLARIGGDISSLGEKSRFVKLESGVYGLTAWGSKESTAGGRAAPAKPEGPARATPGAVPARPAPVATPRPSPSPAPAPPKTAPPRPLSLEFIFGAEKDLKEVTEALALAGSIYPDFDTPESQLALVCTHFLANHPTDEADPKPIKRLLRAWEQGYPAQFLMLWEDKLEFGEELFNDIKRG